MFNVCLIFCEPIFTSIEYFAKSDVSHIPSRKRLRSLRLDAKLQPSLSRLVRATIAGRVNNCARSPSRTAVTVTVRTQVWTDLEEKKTILYNRDPALESYHRLRITMNVNTYKIKPLAGATADETCCVYIFRYICLLQFIYIYLHESVKTARRARRQTTVRVLPPSVVRGRHYGRATVPRLSDPPGMTAAAAEAVTPVSAVERDPRMPPAWRWREGRSRPRHWRRRRRRRPCPRGAAAEAHATRNARRRRHELALRCPTLTDAAAINGEGGHEKPTP